MKLFKKVLAVALVGAMAVSMLTACSSDSSKTADIKKALKDVGVSTNSTMNKETNKAMDKLQSATKAITDGTATAKQAAEEVAKMKEYSFAHTAAGAQGTGKGNGGQYDLYIWTNGVSGKPTGGNYPYLYRVDPIHVTETNLPRLLSENFVKQGVFSGSDASMTALKEVLKTAKKDGKAVENLKVGISCQKVYGYDVLLVTVPTDVEIDQKSATAPVK